jgi:ATP-dependent protease HslVU (ClpYQ) peptidase subunit
MHHKVLFKAGQFSLIRKQGYILVKMDHMLEIGETVMKTEMMKVVTVVMKKIVAKRQKIVVVNLVQQQRKRT